MITIKTESELKLMQISGRVVGEALLELGNKIRPGVTTTGVGSFRCDFLKKHDCIPAFLGYHGYPATICTSVNEQVVHGIPSKRILEEGDIVGIDIGAFYKGFCGDSARTFLSVNVSREIKRLLDITRKALDIGIDAGEGWKPYFRYRPSIQTFVEKAGFSVVKGLCWAWNRQGDA